ncbi:DNA/RNA non-specific endonuclease [Symbiopectobacterium purcellii]|uniref:Endonuclease n=1 Tax=Symbiopectobacterium purcellii TaxID=2871826 RepID=A0ABX9AI37_9ENTR|nr:DNA/RNA non-specific endonuclease [Symbiopectobacterium purcellii]QZN94334.1 DNA/RNA non-specific endonuclease [Symbiopectobacterium purcellii]
MKYTFSRLLPVIFLAACTTTKQPEPVASNTFSPMSVSEDEPEIDNCAVGCPVGGSQQTVIREAYTLNNNRNTRFANWVAYKVTHDSIASGGTRNWRRDPVLPESDTLAPAAYTGANAALSIDRGHQAPLAGLAGSSDWQALNYLSNITPQRSALNQSPWARLELQERLLASRPNPPPVYVVTGPLFTRKIATLPAAPDVEIPSGYWKVIFTGNRPETGEFAAFIMDQDTPRAANICHYQVTINEIEAKTKPHLNIWPSLPKEVATKLKSRKGTLAKAMRCL